MRKLIAVLTVLTMLLLVTGTTTALDINSSKSLQYWSNSNLAFEVNQTGHIIISGNVNMNNNKLQNFFLQGTGSGGHCGPGEFVQYVKPDGSYSCGSAASSAGNTYVNVTGDEMVGMLNMSNNSINNVSYINQFGNTLRVGGTLSLGGNKIAGLANPQNPQEAATKNYVDTQLAGAGTDNQNLSEVLVHGNRANTSIDLSGNGLQNIGNLYGDGGSTSFFSGGASQSQTVTGINANGVLQTTSILVGTTNIQNKSVDANKIVFGAINASHIAANQITNSEIANSGSFTLGGLTLTGNTDLGTNALMNAGTGRTNITATGIIEAGNNVNMHGNDITNYFASACSSGFVKRVWANGSYQCAPDNTGTDKYVAVNASSTPGYIGSDGSTGVLQASGPVTYTLGNNHVTLGLQQQGDIIAGDALNGGATNVLPGTGSVTVSLAQNSVNESYITTSVAGTGLSGGNDNPLSVNTGTGLTFSGDNVAIATGGVGTSQLANQSVTANKLLKGSVNTTHIKDGTIRSSDFGSNVVDGNALKNTGSFTMGSLQVSNDATINGNLYVVGNISNTNVNTLNVNGSILPPNAFNGSFDIGSGARMWRNGYFAGNLHVVGLTDGVNLDSPGNGIELNGNQYRIKLNGNTLALSTSGLKVATGGIAANELAAGAVTDNKIAKNSINSTQLESAAVATANLQNSVVTADKLAKNAVNATHIEANQIGASELTQPYASGSAYESQFVNQSGDVMSGNLDMQGNRIQNVKSVNNGDAVNKSYVDQQAAGSTQDLANVLSQGNKTGGTDIDLQGGSIRDSSGSEICIGDQCT